MATKKRIISLSKLLENAYRLGVEYAMQESIQWPRGSRGWNHQIRKALKFYRSGKKLPKRKKAAA